MKRNKYALYILNLVLFALGGCGGLVIKKYSVTASQKADVYLGNNLKNDLVKVGETPYEFTEDFVHSKVNKYESGSPFFLILKKEGFKSEEFVLQGFGGANTKIDVNMIEDVPFAESREFDNVIQGLFESYRLIRNEKFQEALTLLESLEKDYQALSSIHELRGSVFYLQKKFSNARDSFDLAYRYNPDNKEALRMKKIIERILGNSTNEANK